MIAAAPQHHKASLKDLRHKHAADKVKKDHLKATARKIIHKAKLVRGDIHSIDHQIGEHMKQISDIKERLATNEVQQKELGQQLKVETKRLAIRTDQARLRIREMYMHGEETLASAVVGSDSMGDLASRQFIFERIAQRDRQLFEEVKELRQNVFLKKNEVDTLVVQRRQDIEDEQTAEADLQDERQAKAESLQTLKNQEGEIELLIKELDKEDNDVIAQIQVYEAGAGRVLGPFHGRFIVPVYGARFSSGFGMRFHPILHRTRMHTGQDLAAPHGTPIHASAAGVVVSCSYMHGYGNAIIVDHGGGFATLYGHCSRLIARPGDRVRQGQVIALVGSTGLATGPHCHFEVRIGGRPVNPLRYIHR